VILAAIGGHYSFTKAELEGLTAIEAGFWLGGMQELGKRIKDAAT
jgi:hypothetical protein